MVALVGHCQVKLSGQVVRMDTDTGMAALGVVVHRDMGTLAVPLAVLPLGHLALGRDRVVRLVELACHRKR